MRAYLISNNGSIKDPLNKINVYYSLTDFIEKIVFGNDCFICGLPNTKTYFNEEHIIPDWIIKRFKLKNKKFKLLNSKKVGYTKKGNKVSCCKICNTELGKIYEAPVSNLLRKDYDSLVVYLEKNPEKLKLIFKWMNLLFFKLCFKDIENDLILDRRNNSQKIGHIYDWSKFHHIHCIARSHYTKAIVEEGVYGTILIFKRNEDNLEKFNFFTSPISRSICLEVGDLAIIAILDDSSMCSYFFYEYLKKIGNNKISTIQMIEIFSHLSFLNLNLINRPKYYSTVENGHYEIKMYLEKDNIRIRKNRYLSIGVGDFMSEYIKSQQIPLGEKILDQIKKEKLNFLIDEKFNFIKH